MMMSIKGGTLRPLSFTDLNYSSYVKNSRYGGMRGRKYYCWGFSMEL